MPNSSAPWDLDQFALGQFPVVVTAVVAGTGPFTGQWVYIWKEIGYNPATAAYDAPGAYLGSGSYASGNYVPNLRSGDGTSQPLFEINNQNLTSFPFYAKASLRTLIGGQGNETYDFDAGVAIDTDPVITNPTLVNPTTSGTTTVVTSSPQAVTTSQNNYDPTASGTIPWQTVLPITPTVANASITGLVPPPGATSGLILIIWNASTSNALKLPNQSASSSSGNQWLIPPGVADLLLPPLAFAQFILSTVSGVNYWTFQSGSTTPNLQGATLDPTPPTAGQLPIFNGTKYVPQIAGVTSGGTGLTAAPTAGQLLIGTAGGFALATLTQGAGMSITNSSGGITLATTTSGTVTSVAAAGPTGIFNWSSAITTAGTLTATLISQAANTFLRGPTSGASATPAFGALVLADLPSGYNTIIIGTTPISGGVVTGALLFEGGSIVADDAKLVWSGTNGLIVGKPVTATNALVLKALVNGGVINLLVDPLFAGSQNWRLPSTDISGGGVWLTSGLGVITVTALSALSVAAANLSGTGAAARYSAGAGGTAVTATNVAFSGWGSGATLSVLSGSTDIRGQITVTTSALGTPTLNPTITLTFVDGAWTVAPFPAVNQVSTGSIALPISVATTTTTLVITIMTTPPALTAQAYTFTYGNQG